MTTETPTTPYDALPEHMRDPARRYVEDGEHVGDFLAAVLENNLVEALGRADLENRVAIFAWTAWLYNDVPMDAWGSPEKVTAWIAAHQRVEAPAS